MSSDDKIKIEVQMAKQAPSWYKWAGYAIPVGLGIGYALQPGIWIVYVLCAYSFGLVYWGYECYNQFAEYYNIQQIRDLSIDGGLNKLFEQINGTFQDNDGLISCEEEEDEQDKRSD